MGDSDDRRTAERAPQSSPESEQVNIAVRGGSKRENDALDRNVRFDVDAARGFVQAHDVSFCKSEASVSARLQA